MWLRRLLEKSLMKMIQRRIQKKIGYIVMRAEGVYDVRAHASFIG
ncbi:hypothetical protein SLEP1_g46363 [Rubroshorea leprosula]|uniref:Uncharacterized protein n=1 Tax=Rubroshorea leprosula TaxID=152421 RepID=A0AAV5LLZ3_9ROSI|nr:hypothetical protein SLEP1_g46363 [Rubroshorea leprosula]